MKSKVLKKKGRAAGGSLKNVLNQSEEIKESVEQAADELTSVNEVLKQGKKGDILVQTVQDAITRNEDIEQMVAEAADDLERVNVEIAREVDERAAIETELADIKTNLAEVQDDLLKSRANEEEAQKSALQDPLTCLPNRACLEQVLSQGLIQAKRHGRGLAVLFIDIDNFKEINDRYGHDLGDRVLMMVANRLKDSVREEDTVSRWGGDEFVCLLLEVKRAADVSRLANLLADRIVEEWEENGVVISLQASIGIAIFPKDGKKPDTLIKKADMAMYKAKGSEKRVVRYSKNAN